MATNPLAAAKPPISSDTAVRLAILASLYGVAVLVAVAFSPSMGFFDSLPTAAFVQAR